MFILPYVYHQRELPHLMMYEVCILTVGGTKLWKEDDALCVINDIMEPNGLSVLSHKRDKDIVFCRVDSTKIDMTEYYEWNEIKSNTKEMELFCWRRYYLVQSRHASTVPTVSTAPTAPTVPTLSNPTSAPNTTAVSISWLPFPDTETLGPYSCEELVMNIMDTLTHIKPST
jgi:hypothetical protein